MLETFSDLVSFSATRNGADPAIRHKGRTLDYDELFALTEAVSRGLLGLGLERADRVAVFAEKRPEMVGAMLGASHAGGVFVPVNALLKPRQVSYILNDCDVRFLATTATRFAQLADELRNCKNLQFVILLDDDASPNPAPEVIGWADLTAASGDRRRPRVIASDMAAIMYTSGSTGMPKGVVLSHANLTVGAESVANYIGNTRDDRILSALPLSFDAGLSQLSTGFYAGATVVLHDYLLARDVVRLIERENITGLTAVPPMWIQLAEQEWPEGSAESLKYFANTGGKMPRELLTRLREVFPGALPFLMYGLTESFRSTYLPPDEIDRRPDSIGKAIPNVEVMVVGADGNLCGPGEVGELVHRGPLVSLGYWNDEERTAVRFKPAPGQPAGLPCEELAVWSGDSVRMDEEGFLYFVGRMDEMIKTSGYRVSPVEIEETVFETGLVSEVAALGIAHSKLGQAIVLVVKAKDADRADTDALIGAVKQQVPNYMVPSQVIWRDSLPRNANGKIDRPALTREHADLFGNDSNE